jgi:hypothetical protein
MVSHTPIRLSKGLVNLNLQQGLVFQPRQLAQPIISSKKITQAAATPTQGTIMPQPRTKLGAHLEIPLVLLKLLNPRECWR